VREIVNGLQYVLRGATSWRAMPQDPPSWQNVNDHYRRWNKDGTLGRVHDSFRTEMRKQEGREPMPAPSSSIPSR